MCTDNMPSGTAMALGDVITIRGGTTVEVVNTDAEGRLVMADGLVLAARTGHDAIVDIATLTGRRDARLRHRGRRRDRQQPGAWSTRSRPPADADRRAGLAAAARSGLPPAARLDRRRHQEPGYGENAGAITAALFLDEFVGGMPWAHIDIAGTAQSTDGRPWRIGGLHRVRRPPAGRSWPATFDEAAADGMTDRAREPSRDPPETRRSAARRHARRDRAGRATRCPHPVLMFLYLIIGVIVLSAILAFFNVSVTEQIAVPDDASVVRRLLRGHDAAHRRAGQAP